MISTQYVIICFWSTYTTRVLRNFTQFLRHGTTSVLQTFSIADPLQRGRLSLVRETNVDLYSTLPLQILGCMHLATHVLK